MVKAVAVITGPNGRKEFVYFSADASGTTVEGKISGFNPGDHALVIHIYGDISNDWKSTGLPFKPAGTEGLIDNITVDDEGNADFKFSGKVIALSGPNSVIGRGFVIHSNPSPDLGDGVAWGVIGLSKP